jgi:hypothetical protein
MNRRFLATLRIEETNREGEHEHEHKIKATGMNDKENGKKEEEVGGRP